MLLAIRIKYCPTTTLYRNINLSNPCNNNSNNYSNK